MTTFKTDRYDLTTATTTIRKGFVTTTVMMFMIQYDMKLDDTWWYVNTSTYAFHNILTYLPAFTFTSTIIENFKYTIYNMLFVTQSRWWIWDDDDYDDV